MTTSPSKPEEESIIRHALCGGRNKEVYRNYYYTSTADSEFPVLERMRATGHLIAGRPLWPETDHSIRVYHVTKGGAEAVGLKLPEELDYGDMGLDTVGGSRRRGRGGSRVVRGAFGGADAVDR